MSSILSEITHVHSLANDVKNPSFYLIFHFYWIFSPYFFSCISCYHDTIVSWVSKIYPLIILTPNRIILFFRFLTLITWSYFCLHTHLHVLHSHLYTRMEVLEKTSPKIPLSVMKGVLLNSVAGQLKYLSLHIFSGIYPPIIYYVLIFF